MTVRVSTTMRAICRLSLFLLLLLYFHLLCSLTRPRIYLPVCWRRIKDFFHRTSSKLYCFRGIGKQDMPRQSLLGHLCRGISSYWYAYARSTPNGRHRMQRNLIWRLCKFHPDGQTIFDTAFPKSIEGPKCSPRNPSHAAIRFASVLN